VKDRHLILTTIHRLRAKQVAPFFLSLQRTGFDGDIVVFCSNIDAESVAQIKRWGARVEYFRFSFRHVTNPLARFWPIWKRAFATAMSDTMKERLAHAVFHLFYRRHLLYLEFLRKHGSEYKKVFLTDCRDVFFQADPFGWDQAPGLHVFLEEEANKLGICMHHIRWITSQFGSKTLERWTEKTVSCAGTVFGDVPGMVHYLSQMVSWTMGVKSLRAADGDQGVHNYLVLEGVFPKVTVHENRRGPVMTLGPVRMSSLRFDQDDHVINETGVIVPVLHQYDRDSQLRMRVLSQLDAQKTQRTVS
jgi:hypothetical protein